MRYLYHETTEEESSEIRKALICDSELREQYKELVSIKNQMDDAALEPSATAILNIISHARSKEEKLK